VAGVVVRVYSTLAYILVNNDTIAKVWTNVIVTY
jgi:hypothetical protein